MVWQTTAEVIRVEIMALVTNGSIKDLDNLLKDFKSCEWNILCNATGQLNIQEI